MDLWLEYGTKTNLKFILAQTLIKQDISKRYVCMLHFTGKNMIVSNSCFFCRVIGPKYYMVVRGDARRYFELGTWLTTHMIETMILHSAIVISQNINGKLVISAD